MDNTSTNISNKKKRFCQEYVKDLNGSQAAIRAGYSEKSARITASRMLTNANIVQYIKQLQDEIAERNKITVDECVSILAKIARFDVAELYEKDGNLKSIHDIPKDQREAIEELSVFEEYQGKGEERTLIGFTKKVKASGKQGAIDKLMKHLGGYEKDNNQKESNNVVIFNIPDNGRS